MQLLTPVLDIKRDAWLFEEAGGLERERLDIGVDRQWHEVNRGAPALIHDTWVGTSH